jgi:hypothetical protein
LTGRITAALFEFVVCWVPVLLFFGIPAVIVLLLRKANQRGSISATRVDDFVFLKRPDGSLVRKGIPSRNWMVLVFFGLVILGHLSCLISGVIEGTFEWEMLVSLLFDALLIYVMVYIVRLMRVQPLRLDPRTRMVEWGYAKETYRVPFSDIEGIAYVYADAPEQEGRYGTFDVFMEFKDGKVLVLARLSGKKEQTHKRVRTLIDRVCELTGAKEIPNWEPRRE